MVFRLCSRKAGHHSHEYFNVVSKAEQTMGGTEKNNLSSLSLPPWELLNGQVIRGYSWEIKVGLDLLRQMKALFSAF